MCCYNRLYIVVKPDNLHGACYQMPIISASTLLLLLCVCVADSDMLKRQPPKSHVGLPRDNHNPQRVRPMESSQNFACKPTASYSRFILHQR